MTTTEIHSTADGSERFKLGQMIHMEKCVDSYTDDSVEVGGSWRIVHGIVTEVGPTWCVVRDRGGRHIQTLQATPAAVWLSGFPVRRAWVEG